MKQPALSTHFSSSTEEVAQTFPYKAINKNKGCGKMQRWSNKSPLESSDTSIEDQQKIRMEPGTPTCHSKSEQVAKATLSLKWRSQWKLIKKSRKNEHTSNIMSQSRKSLPMQAALNWIPLNRNDLKMMIPMQCQLSPPLIANSFQNPKPKNNKVQEHALDADSKDDTDNSSTVPTTTQDFNPVKASPYEWRVCNDEWLQAIMQTAMNDATVPGIPTIDHVEHLTHPNPPTSTSPSHSDLHPCS